MAKEHPIDVEVREKRRLQDECAARKCNRTAQLVLITVSALLLVAFGVGIYLLPQKTVSEEENRALQTFPRFSLESLLSGEFTASLATFYADQFPLRDAFVGLKGATEIAMQKQENNGVLCGKDGTLIDRLEYDDSAYKTLDTNLSACDRFREITADQKIPLTFAVAPRTVDVLKSAYPALYSPDRADVLLAKIRASAPDCVDLSVPLSERADAGEYVMYRTDHHWTSLGAYYAYVALAETMGYTPLPRDAFTEETVSETFCGTTYSASGMKWIEPDRVTLFRITGDDRFSVTVHDTEKTTYGFYAFDALAEKDCYRVFLGGNHGHVSIRKTDADRETLLLVKDSFALSLVPFLAQHYDIEMIDLRYYSGKTVDLIPTADRVLVLMGADSLAESDVLRKLLFGAQS